MKNNGLSSEDQHIFSLSKHKRTYNIFATQMTMLCKNKISFININTYATQTSNIYLGENATQFHFGF
jgi:hypothetical protein